MQWESTVDVQPRKRLRFDHEPVSLSIEVEASSEYGRWVYFSIGFGMHTHEEPDTLKDTWPRDAIRIARAKLDKLEEQLG